MGQIHEPFQQHVTAKYAIKVCELVRQTLGVQGKSELMRRVISFHLTEQDGVPLRLAGALQDEHAWLNCSLSLAIGLHAIMLTGRQELWREAGFLGIADWTTTHAAFAGILGLRWLYRHVAEANRNFNTVVDLTYESAFSTPGSATLLKKNVQWYQDHLASKYGRLASEVIRMDCEITDGALAAIPILFGLPPASVTHECCQKDGAEVCRIRVEFKDLGLFGRVCHSFLGISPTRRRLLSRVGQLEVLIRDQAARLDEAYECDVAQARDLSLAEAEIRMGKAYAGSVAHDINNALGPARSGVEEILGVFARGGGPSPVRERNAGSQEKWTARTASKTMHERLTRIGHALQKGARTVQAPQWQEAVRLLSDLRCAMERVCESMAKIHMGINQASDYTASMNDLAKAEHAGREGHGGA